MKKKLLVMLMTLLLVCLNFTSTLLAEGSNTTTITYNVKANIELIDNGENPSIIYKYQKDVGEYLIEPDHSYPYGLLFDGWYLEDGKTKWNFETDTVTRHMVLTTKYVNIRNRISNKTDFRFNYLNGYIHLNVIDVPLSIYEYEQLEKDKDSTLIVKLITGKIDQRDFSFKEKQKISKLLNEIGHNNHGACFDAYILKTLSNDESYQEIVYELENPTDITIKIPKEIQNNNYEYSIIEVDDGEVNLIYKGKYQNNDTITFTTDKLAKYVLSYKKLPSPEPYTPVNTGIIQNKPLIDVKAKTLLVVVGLLALTTIVKKQDEKEDK